MSYPASTTLADWPINCQLVDISAASIAYATPGAPGKLQRLYVCTAAAITGSDTTVTIKKNSTTIGTIAVTVTGAAAGKVYEASFTGTEAERTFAADDTLVLDSDGVSSTTSIAVFTAVFRRL